MSLGNRLIILVFSLLACLALALVAGCGKKAWPEPDAKQEVFAFSTVSAQMHETCLVVQAVVSGNWTNLDGIFVELAPDDCKDCPFRPGERREFSLNSPFVVQQEHLLAVNVCGLDKNASYRWRLVGKNVFSGLREVLSPVGVTSPVK